MRKNFIVILVPVIAVLFLFACYRLIFVRTVYYEIAGVKIPSYYNAFTGNVRPIENYRGRADIKTIESRRADKVGLSDDQVFAAKVRWAMFENWANARSEYRGWDTDSEIFRKANEAFRNSVKR